MGTNVVSFDWFNKIFFCSPITIEVFVCLESGFLEITSQTFLCLFAIKKVGQRKTLSCQRKIWLYFQESVFLLFFTENIF
jgi:hypothetical protein